MDNQLINGNTSQAQTPDYAANAPQFLTTKEVMSRYRIASPATLWKWKQSLGFPKPVHNGRHYEVAALNKWDSKQSAA